MPRSSSCAKVSRTGARTGLGDDPCGADAARCPLPFFARRNGVGRVAVGGLPLGAISTPAEEPPAWIDPSTSGCANGLGARADMTSKKCVRTKPEAASPKRAAHAAEAVRVRNHIDGWEDVGPSGRTSISDLSAHLRMLNRQHSSCCQLLHGDRTCELPAVQRERRGGACGLHPWLMNAAACMAAWRPIPSRIVVTSFRTARTCWQPLGRSAGLRSSSRGHS
jgi:hypothetical protein